MRRTIQRRGVAVTACLAVVALVAQASASATAPGQDAGGLSPGQEQAVAAGLQVAPKSAGARSAGSSVNPYTAQVPDLTKVDFAAWRERLAAAGKQRQKSPGLAEARRAANARTPAAAATVVHDEQEPAGTSGSNDTVADAERIPGFGTAGNRNNLLRILGEKAALPVPAPRAVPAGAEDNGAIPLATDTPVAAQTAITTTGQLGDGPHGSAGDGSNDFDFYEVALVAGQTLTVETSSTAFTDTVIALYEAGGGDPVIVDDDSGPSLFSSRFDYRVAEAGTYYVLVAGYSQDGPLPADPNDSGSGAGGADEGPYNLRITQARQDYDNYAVRLRPGDVLGGVANGLANALTVYRPDGTQMVGSKYLDASSLYAPQSPLPGGGNTTFAYVAEEAGWYVLAVDGDPGDYAVQLEAYRPGAETDRKQRQVVVLDFEGGRVNTGIWGGPGQRELSPFSAFVSRWGIPRSRERALINQITRDVQDNLQHEVAEGGLNPGLQVEVVNTRTNPGLRDRTQVRENVSRVVVGGTIEESGIPTIGIAQYIDPGNYGHEDTALVLLDILSSDDPEEPASLNTYLTEASDRERFVSRAVSNVTAHEVGHMIGSYHTDNQSETVNLMDSGGAGFENLFGVGPDGVGGTADDPDVAFEEDTYSPVEGFTGLEDTQNVTAWAYPG